MKKDKCSSSLAWLKYEEYSVIEINLFNATTGKEETIDLNPEGLLGPGKNITETDLDTIYL